MLDLFIVIKVQPFCHSWIAFAFRPIFLNWLIRGLKMIIQSSYLEMKRWCFASVFLLMRYINPTIYCLSFTPIKLETPSSCENSCYCHCISVSDEMQQVHCLLFLKLMWALIIPLICVWDCLWYWDIWLWDLKDLSASDLLKK